jgi:hypothetical protein
LLLLPLLQQVPEQTKQRATDALERALRRLKEAKKD